MTIVEEPTRTEPVLGRTLLELDPRELLDNPLNPRTEIGDVSEDAASMRESGVLEPLIVMPAEDGRYVILFGHRRRAAAIEAGLATVPCDVRPEYAQLPPEQLADMLAENVHRKDLTPLEEAAGYAQLAMFDGWNPTRIATRLGKPVEAVKAGIAASRVDERLRPKVVEGGITLEQAAAIEEFAGDEKAYARLLRAAEYPPGLHHALAEERHRQTLTARADAVRVGLRDAGVRIIAKPRNYRYGSVELGVEELTDQRGIRLTVEDHASCPGHAAFISDGEPEFVCQHPKEWGHGVPGYYRHQSTVEIQAQEEAAQAAREYEAALKVADDARVSFLTEYLTRKGRPPAGTLRTALMVLCRFNTGAEPRVAAARLLHPAGPGADPRDTGPVEAALVEAVLRSADNRLPYLALAYAAAAGETNIRRRNNGWQYDPAFTLHWLDTLAELGYPLSDAELQLREHAVEQIAEMQADEDDEDEDLVGVDSDEEASQHDVAEVDDSEGDDPEADDEVVDSGDVEEVDATEDLDPAEPSQE